MSSRERIAAIRARHWWVEIQRDRRGLTFGWTERDSPIGFGGLWLSIRWAKHGRGLHLNRYQLRKGLGLSG